jgi:hypothetical protein
VRRVLDEASRGVRFDEMAVLLRTPQQYLGLLEHACARGDVPAYFDRGTRRPDPAGRAFIALLSCAVDGLSAKRFDEYLSLGQVPRMGERGERPAVVLPDDEVFAELTDEAAAIETDDGGDPAAPLRPAIDSDDEAVISGTLRSPWKWEELIVESAVVGGRTREEGSVRWRRRLDGLAADYKYRIAELKKDEPESARIARYERDLRNLIHLRRFALPIIEELASWPDRATWGEWLVHFEALASRALQRPERVLRTLADLRPMAEIGPVTLEEARDVLHDRRSRSNGSRRAAATAQLFVGTPHQARGRAFRVVFVPGLAERVVPQRPREDPLLLDDARRTLGDASLVRQEQRGAAERLLLKIAIGAATERLYLSYPRLDVAETRARVPSFYALDVMRAITGRVPDHRVLASDAAEEGGANLAWPAPRGRSGHRRSRARPGGPQAAAPPRSAERQRPRALHARLERGAPAIRDQPLGATSRPAWSSSDGLVKVVTGTEAAIARHRLGKRAYSLSALQRFSTCPYQFLLSTIYRLEPWDEPEPLVRMDPLTRGSLYHKAQAEF